MIPFEDAPERVAKGEESDSAAAADRRALPQLERDAAAQHDCAAAAAHLIGRPGAKRSGHFAGSTWINCAAYAIGECDTHRSNGPPFALVRAARANAYVAA